MTTLKNKKIMFAREFGGLVYFFKWKTWTNGEFEVQKLQPLPTCTISEKKYVLLPPFQNPQKTSICPVENRPFSGGLN